MRRLPLRTATVLATVLLMVAATPAFADVGFRFEGSGWGHGIGMSQYGAFEQARDGRTARQIIEHYYQGATAGKPSLGLGRIRIGLTQNTYSLAFAPRNGGATIRNFGGRDYSVPAGATRRVVVHDSDGTCNLKRPSGGTWATIATTGGDCSSRITFSGAIDLSTEPHRYGHGQIRLTSGTATKKANDGSTARAFHVVADLPDLETYLYGLAEVPSSWPTHALRAQAIAARSYAAYSLLGTGISSQCGCHLYDTVSSQVYAGLTKDTPAWRTAVDATAGRVVYAPGQGGTRKGVVQAFYSSSSGGRTENIEDVWRNSTPRPYYSSVRDPWSLRSSNPYAYWTINHSESALRSKLAKVGIRFDAIATIAVTARNESGSARTVTIRGRHDGSGKTVSITGADARRHLDLRSAHIRRIFLPPFVDDDGSRFERDIIWIAERDITKGCNPPTNDRYCPTESVSRAEMAAFLVRAEGLTDTSREGWFRDVPREGTFAVDINKLATAGITKGCNPPANDRFCPGDAVSRAEMAAFLHRALR